MSRFEDRKNQSELWYRARTTLEELIDAEGLNKAETAFCSAFTDRSLAFDLKHLGAKLSSVPSLRRLLGMKTRGMWRPDEWDFDKTVPPEHAPHADHFKLLLRNGKPWRYVSEPYDLQLDDMRSMVEICDAFGLSCGITGGSWHYPTRTVQVSYERDPGRRIYSPVHSRRWVSGGPRA